MHYTVPTPMKETVESLQCRSSYTSLRQLSVVWTVSSRENTGKLHGMYQSALWSFQGKLILKGSITKSKALENVRDSKCKQFGI